MRHNAAVRLRSSGWIVDEHKTGMNIYKMVNFKEELLHCTKFAFYLMGEELTKDLEEQIETVAEGYYSCSVLIVVDKECKIEVRREDKLYRGGV